jgi:hypothetical protein
MISLRKTGFAALGIRHAVQIRKRANHPIERGEHGMNFTIVQVGPLAALIAGILILVMPRLLNYIVAIYLIIIGVLGLAAHLQ